MPPFLSLLSSKTSIDLNNAVLVRLFSLSLLLYLLHYLEASLLHLSSIESVGEREIVREGGFVCVCMCVGERDSEIGCVCVCVCVCVWAREKER